METMTAPAIATGLLSHSRVGRFTASMLGELMTEPRTLTAEQKARKAAGIPVFGETAKKAIAMKAWERLAGVTNTGPLTRATERGNDLEAVAFSLLNQYWRPLTKSYANDGFLEYGDHAGATPDAYCDNGQATVDIKCPWNGEKLLLFADEVADDDHEALMGWDKNYYWQVMLQMLAAGTNTGYLVYFDDRVPMIDADVTDYMGLPFTQFNPERPGFSFVARKFTMKEGIKERVDAVIAAAVSEREAIISRRAA